MRTGTLIFLLLTGLFSSSLCTLFGVIIYISDKVTWSEARDYCRQHHTDLTSVNSQLELVEMLVSGNGTGNAFETGWIGLYKDVNGTWRWSGGKDALFPLSEKLQETAADHSCVIQNEKDLRTASCEDKFPFYCFQSNLVLVEEKKAWEAAQEHCRSLDMELVSTVSESALNQALQSSRKALTAQVWTGLRYLGGSWLWADGTCAGFEAWCQKGMPQCPAANRHCGALPSEGRQMESRDCADQLNFVCY
ncbi:uncharacterized protein LOC106518322 [Austrofundulus limnaeus]|uniref:Uncharacterized protein LOC106518322 n=1 Tax=Austrofundulus limnaeus TaxID=52670 RepID=A0A2I4BBC9_AUSLI|nr:PREDICTED: uncharacterized protein LOC106518322 [Austrofundulus limnaeus]